MIQALRFCFLIMVTLSCSAQENIPLYQKGQIPNWRDNDIKENIIEYTSGGAVRRFITQVTQPELTVYLPDRKVSTGIGVIICPGGGYSQLAMDHEGHYMAMKYNENGIAAFVLKYRMPMDKSVDNKEIVPLQDAQRAIQIVRENAKKWDIDPNKVGMTGSSAGGHLVSTAGTHYMDEVINNPGRISLRPDFLILNYPVISFTDSLTHYGSRFNLIGKLSESEMDSLMKNPENIEEKLSKVSIDEQKIQQYSNELWVTPETPPTFITHAIDDKVVKVQNSLLFIAALQENHVPVETFFYTKGGHGFGMRNPTSDINWMDICMDWLLKLFGK